MYTVRTSGFLCSWSWSCKTLVWFNHLFGDLENNGSNFENAFLHCGDNGLGSNSECIGRNNEEQSADHTVEDPTSCFINAVHTVVRGNMYESNDTFNCRSCCKYQCTQARCQSSYDDRAVPYVVRVQCRIQRLPWTTSVTQLVIGLGYSIPLWFINVRKLPVLHFDDFLKLLPIAILNAGSTD